MKTATGILIGIVISILFIVPFELFYGTAPAVGIIDKPVHIYMNWRCGPTKWNVNFNHQGLRPTIKAQCMVASDSNSNV